MNFIQMTRLGKMGRWGNQVIQYLFLRTYAQRQNLYVQCPDWIGERIFDLDSKVDDFPILEELPEYLEIRDGVSNQPQPPVGDASVNHDYIGWGQFHTSWYDKHILGRIFHPGEEEFQRLLSPLLRLSTAGVTRVGIHIRRGDYGQQIFYLTPIEWYLRLLKPLLTTLHRPVLFVASDDDDAVDELSFLGVPVFTADNLGVPFKSTVGSFNHLPLDEKPNGSMASIDFYPDFYLMSQCEYIIGGNSTFSFAAAMLAPRLRAYYRSKLSLEGFELVDPWNAYPLLQEKVDDYPELVGISVPTNQYWRR